MSCRIVQPHAPEPAFDPDQMVRHRRRGIRYIRLR